MPRRASHRTEPAVTAVLDIGSNTARLVAYRHHDGGATEVASARSALKLIRDVDANGSLSLDAYLRTRAALHQFREVADAAGATEVLAVATSAVRDAANGAAFVAALEADTGLSIRILDGDAEARLAAQGALLDAPSMSGYLLDGGGGSLEIAEVQDGVVGRRWSTSLGALRQADRWLRSDPPTPDEVAALVEHVQRTVEALDIPPLSAGETLLASGGAVRNLLRRARVVAPEGAERSMAAEELRAVRTDLVSKTQARRALTEGLRPDRADSIAAGAVIMDTLLSLLGASEVRVSRHGLREGVLASQLARSTPDRRSVEIMAA